MIVASVLPRYRWFVLSVFVLSTAINYLDRQTLTSLAPLIRAEFHLSNAGYGLILTAFSITYAVGAPLAGLLIDRFGLNRAISFAVALWSSMGIATGLTRGAAGLVACRSVLGMAEAAGIPGAGKAIHQYLKPSERAMGNALNQAGVSLGMMLAPPVATFLALRGGWRQAFFVTGIAGLLWIPLWNRIARRAKGGEAVSRSGHRGILRDRRLWIFVAANALGMVAYSLWTNWTTLYLVDVHRLTLAQAAWYAWIPPVFAVFGGLGGGWLSLRLVNRGVAPATARYRVCLVAAALALIPAALPFAPAPGWAAAGISLSIFAVAAFSVNMYSLPLDVFGGARAAFAVSLLVASYGALQAVISPLFGRVIDTHGYMLLLAIVPLTSLAACFVLRLVR
ncbi:MAG TPA: MFS transporter [Bryobacteraceae bacterium]|nr:MFS transporter [Bryobacteraceae bacterium]